jgi:hypothetical protein
VIDTKEDLLSEVYEDGDYHDGLQGWLGYYVDNDDVLTVSFEAINDEGSPGDAIVGRWKLVPVDG